MSTFEKLSKKMREQVNVAVEKAGRDMQHPNKSFLEARDLIEYRMSKRNLIIASAFLTGAGIGAFLAYKKGGQWWKYAAFGVGGALILGFPTRAVVKRIEKKRNK